MARNPPPDPSQYVLDFSSRHSDACRQLKTALKRISGVDLKHWSFLMLIHNFADDRTGLVRDYDELADLLWCSRATAIRMVARLADVELVQVLQTFTADGDARKNEYSINWETVRRLSSKSIEALGARVRKQSLEAEEGEWSHGDTTPSHGDTTPSHGDTSLGRILTENSCIPYPYPGRSSGSDSERSLEGKVSSGDSRKSRPSQELRKVLFAEISELAKAQDRRLLPQPAGDLKFGIFTPKVLTLELLRNARFTVEWHCRQLSAPQPAAGDTEADLLLTMAARERALKTPEKEVKKNRVAMFVSVLSHGNYRLVLPWLPDAMETLDKFAEHLGGRKWLMFEQPSLAAVEAPA